MISHLTPADYKTMPWANGKGVTVEMLRVDRDGAVLWRLSRASVVENGDFSLFAGIDRNLTVISGPGFDLVGDGIALSAKPLVPVAFPGDIPIRAVGVAAPSDDFNVMTARGVRVPEVQVIAQNAELPAAGTLAVFALSPGEIAGRTVGRYDLIITAGPVSVQAPAIAVRLFD